MYFYGRHTKGEKNKMVKKKINISLLGGIAGLVLGFWMIFITNDNFGFLPALAGALLLIWGWRVK